MEEKPRNLKVMLAEAKNGSELMVDLAYAALYFDDGGMADAVLGLEQDMSGLVHEMRSLALLAVRNPKEVESMSSVLQVISSIDRIGNAAADIAKIVTRHLGIPRALLAELARASEVSHRLVVADRSSLANRTLAELELPVEVGMRVVAIQRERQWITDIGGESTLEPGDALFVRGDPEGIAELRELASASAWVSPAAEPESSQLRPITDLARAVATLVEMKDLSEAAVGLAYSALVLQDSSPARAVRSLQGRLDTMKVEMQTWVLRAASDDVDPDGLRGLLHVAEAAEDIGDQALKMASLVLNDGDVHPVLALALGDADDVVMQVPVGDGSAADGATLGSLGLSTDSGYNVLAVHRDNSFIYNPAKSVKLKAGDELLASGPEEGRERFAAQLGYGVEVDSETGLVELIAR